MGAVCTGRAERRVGRQRKERGGGRGQKPPSVVSVGEVDARRATGRSGWGVRRFDRRSSVSVYVEEWGRRGSDPSEDHGLSWVG